MENFEELLKIEWLDNSLQEYLVALGVFVGIYLVLKIFKLFVLKYLSKIAQKTTTTIDDECVHIIDKAPQSLYSFIGLYLAAQLLEMDSWIHKLLDSLLIILLVYWATHVASQLIEYLLNQVNKKGRQSEEKTNSHIALSIVVKIALWSTGILLILSNLGVNISALVASLGIGGVAVALAVQNILGDIFSSFSIYLDQPFSVGDYVIVGEHQGTVKKIGLKTTRIQALQGEEIVISNQELTSTRVRNFKKMKKRRAVFHFGVTYDTPSKKLEVIPQMIENLIDQVETAEFDRAHFKEFADFSLNFEVVYHVTTREYADYMNTQQEINFAVKRIFEKEKIEMAFPTQTLHISKN